jgi:hypothetical protein
MQSATWERSIVLCALGCALSVAATGCDVPDGADAPDQVEQIRSALTSGATKINCGDNGAQSPFIADVDFTGGSTVTRANTIDMTAVNGNSPAPTAVYQSQRFDTTSFSYTLPGFTASSWNQVRLHFADTHWTAAGQRVFNVIINGKTVLSNFDIIQTVGAGNKALIESFTMQADMNGKYVMQFVKVTDAATVSGIEVAPIPSTGTGMQTTTNGTAYAKLCAQNLVPLPPNFGGNGGTGTKCLACMAGNGSCEGCVTGPNGEWKYSGQLSSVETEQSFNGQLPVDMFFWESAAPNPPGLCMMATRQAKSTNDGLPFSSTDADFAGVICQAASGAVCYWDVAKPTQLHWNPSAGLLPNEQGHVVIPSSAKTITSTTSIPTPVFWVGGNDLIGGSTTHNYQDMCSDCHGGRNAFNNHPGTATDLLGRNKLASATNWTPAAWPSPIVPSWDPGALTLGGPWPLNPGPQSWTGINTSCSSCHTEGGAGQGQFASASLATPNYCFTLITEAATRENVNCTAGDIHCPNGAMPPFVFSPPMNSLNDGFVSKLLGQPGGQCQTEFRTLIAPIKGGGTLVNGPSTLATSPFLYGFYLRAATYGINSTNKVVTYDPTKMQWLTTNGTANKVAYSPAGNIWTIRQSGSTSFICEAVGPECTGGTTCDWRCDSIGYAGYSQIIPGGSVTWAIDASKFVLYATTLPDGQHYQPDSFFVMAEWPVNDPISQVSVGDDGDVWVLSQQGNLTHEIGGELSGNFAPVTSPPGGHVVSVSVGKAADVWVATNSASSTAGLYRFLPTSGTWEKHCLTTGCGQAYTKVSVGGYSSAFTAMLSEVWALDSSGNAYRVDQFKGTTQASISKITPPAPLTQLYVGGPGDVLGLSSAGTVYSFY